MGDLQQHLDLTPQLSSHEPTELLGCPANAMPQTGVGDQAGRLFFLGLPPQSTVRGNPQGHYTFPAGVVSLHMY